MFPQYIRLYQCCLLYSQNWNNNHYSKIQYFTIYVMSKLLKFMPSFPICFFESKDFCHIILIVLSSLKKCSTMLFTLDPLTSSLRLWGMMLEITTTFVVDLTLFASSIVFSEIGSRDPSIFRLFIPQRIMIRLGLLLTVYFA